MDGMMDGGKDRCLFAVSACPFFSFVEIAWNHQ